jgi:hypothetical protein
MIVNCNRFHLGCGNILVKIYQNVKNRIFGENYCKVSMQIYVVFKDLTSQSRLTLRYFKDMSFGVNVHICEHVLT